MPRYRVLIREVHVSHRVVEADSESEALDEAGDIEENYSEYSHSMDKETWTVEEEPPSKVELLVAWDDGTWTTETEEVPVSSFDNLNFENDVMTWVNSSKGLIGQTRFRSAVAFSFYNHCEEE